MLCLWLSVAAFSALSAHEYKIGSLEIGHPYARAMPASVKVSSGYLTIRNEGGEDDRLIEVRTEQAGRIEIHEMIVEDNIMRMRPLPDGLEIAAGETIALEPGGYHLMIFDPKEPLIAGTSLRAELHFAKAGIIEVTFNIEDMADQSGEANQDDHHSMH